MISTPDELSDHVASLLHEKGVSTEFLISERGKELASIVKDATLIIRQEGGDDLLGIFFLLSCLFAEINCYNYNTLPNKMGKLI